MSILLFLLIGGILFHSTNGDCPLCDAPTHRKIKQTEILALKAQSSLNDLVHIAKDQTDIQFRLTQDINLNSTIYTSIHELALIAIKAEQLSIQLVDKIDTLIKISSIVESRAHESSILATFLADSAALCDPNPCWHDSECGVDFLAGSFMCNCYPGYSGLLCEHVVTTTTSKEIKNGKTVTVCEYDTLAIECPSGQSISIISGFYGRTDKTTCIQYSCDSCDTSCSSDVTKQLINLFNLKNSYKITIDNGYLGVDPCYGTVKYSIVSYKCELDIKVTTPITTGFPATTKGTKKTPATPTTGFPATTKGTNKTPATPTTTGYDWPYLFNLI